MIRRSPGSTRTETLVPETTLVRSGDEHDFLAQHPLDIALHHAGRKCRRTQPARPAEMREQQHLGALARQFKDRGPCSLDPRDITGRTFVLWQVEIEANQRDLAR